MKKIFFKRLIETLVASIICSLPILLVNLGIVPETEKFKLMINCISSVGFFALTGFFAYEFSFECPTALFQIIGNFVTYLTYIAFSVVGYFIMPPAVFNFMFLPLRVFEFLELMSIHSIICVHCLCIAINVVAGVIGKRQRRISDMYDYSYNRNGYTA